MTMQDQIYDVAVVGGGLAGLTAAVYLKKAGLAVVLCEKENKTGGLVNSFEYEGFTFDAGARSLETGGVLFPMLRDLEIALPGSKDSVSIGIGSQKINMDSAESLTAYGAMLESLYPEEGPAIRKAMDQAMKVTRADKELREAYAGYFGGRAGVRANRKTAGLHRNLMYRIRDGQSSRLQVPAFTYLEQMTGNRSLAGIMAQHVGRSFSAAFALGRTSRCADSWYPDGGTGRLSESLTEKFLAQGGEVKMGYEIQEVDLERRMLSGRGGKAVRFKRLIWAANPQRLYEAAQGFQGREWESEWESQKAKVFSHMPGDSVLTFFVGVRLPLEYFRGKVSSRSFFTPETTGVSGLGRENWFLEDPEGSPTKQEQVIHAAAWTRSFLDRTTYEISIPVFRDAKLAPEGQTGLIVSTLFDYNLVSAVSELGAYEFWKEDAKDHVIKVLERTIFPGLGEAVSFALVSSPLTLAQFSGNPGGTPYGWAYTGDGTLSEYRAGKISNAVKTPAPHVFQAGQWTFSPAGVPASILTGKLAADAVLAAGTGE